MNLLRCATHTVANAAAAASRATKWLDYVLMEQGTVPDDLAQAWGAPASAGRRYSICQPASGAPVFLRFVEGDPVPAYRPIRSFGWAAIEICVQDVLAVNDRMRQPGSPFVVIGPPNRIAGLSTIFPMQVRGPDQETLYFTEMIGDPAINGLPVARAPIDSVFILVLACRDVQTSADWFARMLTLATTEPQAIRYSMINQAFDLPPETQHEIVTANWNADIFLEFDQYPAAATERPAAFGALPPGVSICTLFHPGFDRIDADWFSPPVPRSGILYGNRRAGILKTPEGALVEVVEA
jgi:hypothetical protein